MSQYAVVGAGLAGCECAFVLAHAGFKVTLFEQKPRFRSQAHTSDGLAELVCSNSLRSDDCLSAIGLLHEELRSLGSLVMTGADACRVPADRALAVDREAFSEKMSQAIAAEPHINLVSRQIQSIEEEVLKECGPLGIIIAAGPLAAENLAASLAEYAGKESCYFYDAIAPIVWTDSLDINKVFRASRHSEGEGDYLNCPMSRDEYFRFYEELLAGKTFAGREFEQLKHFEGCMPIEALAAAGPRTLSFGPFKPVGLINPATGARPYAVLQLRAENVAMTTCNLVGCQTRLLQSEQERIFRLVPGLENAEFCRFGSMHRNTYVNAPHVLNDGLALVNRPDIYLAGQLTGVEGYVESAACGLWLGLSLAAAARGMDLPKPPPESALGALLGHLRTPTRHFLPSNVNFGLMPPLQERTPRKERKLAYSNRARQGFSQWLNENRANLRQLAVPA